MAVVARTVRQHCPSLAVGVQVLSACNTQALAVAAAAGKWDEYFIFFKCYISIFELNSSNRKLR